MINFRFAIIFLAAFGVSNAQQPTSEQEIPLDIQTLCNRTTLPQPPNEQPSLGLSPIQYVNISTGTIAYRVYSPPQANTSLPAILLITGFGNSMANWPSNLIRGLADMHSQVILFDNRGQGLSTDLSPNQRISIQGMANDTAQLIQALNLSSKPDLVGYSMGGMIATALLTNYSSLIDTAVVAHGSAGGKNSTLPTREATQIAIEQNNTVAELGILFDLSVPRERSGACIHYFQDVLGSSSWAPVNSTTTQRQLGAITDYFTVGGVFNSLKTVQNPVYLIGGLSDQLVPVDNVRKMASQLPISWLSIFPGKHGALLQNQDMFLSVYDEFLNVWRM